MSPSFAPVRVEGAFAKKVLVPEYVASHEFEFRATRGDLRRREVLALGPADRRISLARHPFTVSFADANGKTSTSHEGCRDENWHMASSGKIPAPADAQPAQVRGQDGADPELVELSPARPGEFVPHGSEVPAGRLLFLDDDPRRAIVFLNHHPDAVWVLTAKECIGQLAQEWDQVHLDHDLGGETYVDPLREDCGMEVVRWLCASVQDQLRETWFIIHSHNCEAASDMVKHLRESGYHAVYRPFGVELLDWLQDWQPQLPAPAQAPKLPAPPKDREQPDAMVSPSVGTRPAGRLVAFFKLVRRLIARRPVPGALAPSNQQAGKGGPGQTASREAGSHS